jgi:hypothetical protein
MSQVNRSAADDASAKSAALRHPPWLALRIGITGARALPADRIVTIRAHLQEALGAARQTMMWLAREPRVRSSYDGDDGGVPQAWLRFLSPLARGADRLAAEAALSLGYDLFVPMPFARAEYEKDFSGAQNPTEPALSAAEDLAQFVTLIGRAGDGGKAFLSLDGDRSEQDRSYEAVGRFVVRNSDILLAVWDGAPGNGRGGTAEIVEYAALHGTPVLWIHATEDCAPVWIRSRADLRQRIRTAADPLKALRASIESQILPPPAAERNAHGLVARLSRLGQRKRLEPLKDYSWRDPKPPGAWARAYDVTMQWASRMPEAKPTPQPAPVSGSAAARYWADRYQPADARTRQYAARYRSAYVWLFVFAIATLVFGASAAVAHGHFGIVVVAVLLEALVLALILLIAASAIRGDWHQRFIEYRLLAELCRKQQVLCLFGRSVSLGAIHRMVHDDGGEVPPVAAHHDRKAWIAWLISAWERAAPLPNGSAAVALAPIVQEQIIGGLIDTQLDYHRARAERSERADETFFKFGQWCFIAVCICVVLKLFVLPGTPHGDAAQSGWREGLSEAAVLALTWLAIVLPTVSAAAFGIRSYTELQLLAEQSRHMIFALKTAKRRIESIDVTQPLAIEDVGAETQIVATLMLQDIDGWLRLFKLKAIEP